MRASALPQYIEKYGIDGWIAGLTDARPAIKEPATQLVARDAPDSVQVAKRDPLRVKDVVYLYYLKVNPSHKETMRVLTATHAERDAKIAQILAEIRRQGLPTSSR